MTAQESPLAAGLEVAYPVDYITFSEFTSATPLSKSFALVDGKITKAAAAQMFEGDCVRRDMPFAALPDYLATLSERQACAWGVAAQDRVSIRTQAQAQPPETIARTRENFQWADGAGVLMLDFDNVQLTPAEAGAALAARCPALASSAWFMRPSLSASVHLPDQQPSQPKSWHVYVLVQSAADIPRAGQNLFDRLWLAGHGHIALSKAGSMLTRTLVDAAVWQPERLDFVGKPVVGSMLAYTAPAVEWHPGGPLDTAAALPGLTPLEQNELAQVQAAARAKAKPKALEQFKVYADAQLATSRPDDPARFVKQLRSILTGRPTLPEEFLLHHSSGGTVAVGEVAANPSDWAGERFCDPLEPGYGHDTRIAVCQLDRRGIATVYSHAHGGIRYHLRADMRYVWEAKSKSPALLALRGASLEVAPDPRPPAAQAEADPRPPAAQAADETRAPAAPKRPQVIMRLGQAHETVAAIFAVLRECPDLYDYGGLLAQGQQQIRLLDRPRLICRVAEAVELVKPDAKGDTVQKDLPPAYADMLLSKAHEAALRVLDGCVTAPCVRPGGGIVVTSGYDVETRLLFALPHELAEPPADAQAALTLLMQPFDAFPWAAEQDEANFVAALLTAVQRRVLPTAPAFGLDAPVQGSGKTLLAQCLAVLSTGQDAAVMAFEKDEAEIRKRLLACLLDGGGTLILDNILGSCDSAALAAFLTAPVYADRLLGESKRVTLPNRVLTLLTGNNLTFAGDLPRRVLTIRIDPRMADPQGRTFDVDPLAVVHAHRQTMARAACVIIQAYRDSGAAPRPGRAASFEVWDELVRQPVAWLTGYDPLDSLKEAVAHDPDRELLSDLLQSLRRAFGLSEFTAKDVLRAADQLDELQDMLPHRATARGVGMGLRYRCDRVVAGLVLRQHRAPNTNQNSYRIELVPSPGVVMEQFRAEVPVANQGVAANLRNYGTKTPDPLYTQVRVHAGAAHSTTHAGGVCAPQDKESHTRVGLNRQSSSEDNPYYRSKSGD